MSEVVYLDNAATTPLDPAVALAMSYCLGAEGEHGNPASTHAYGRRAAALVETARAQVAALIAADPAEICFTSGATESNNLAVLGLARANSDRGRHIVTTSMEHKALLEPCRRLEKDGFALTYVSPDSTGRVAAQAVAAALRADTVLVSVMMANNEIGVLQDIAAIGAECRARSIAFHTDAAQAVGKVPVDVRACGVDLMSLTAHKLYGPKGIGALYVRRGARAALQPVIFGGGQESGLRGGTLATHQVVGFGVACELAGRLLALEAERLATLRDRLWEHLRALGGVYLNGEAAPRLPHLLNVSFAAVQGESLIGNLPELAVSTGSACDSASAAPSRILRALGRDSQLAQSSLRISLGRFTTEHDVFVAGEAICRAVRDLRAISPAWVRVSRSIVPPADGPNAHRSGRQGSLAAGNGEAAIHGGFDMVSGEAGGPGEDTWVRLHLELGAPPGDPSRQNGRMDCAPKSPPASDPRVVRHARFEAFGCPHTLDVLAWLSSELVGRDRAGLVPGTPREWADRHAVPIEKLGRLLVIEDALQDCLRHWR